MFLVKEDLGHIGRIYTLELHLQLIELGKLNMKIQKLKSVWNTAPDNLRVLNFMRNPKLAHILVSNSIQNG